MAKKDKKKKDKEKKKGGFLKTLLLIVISIVLIVLIKSTFVFVICGLIPSFVAYYVDATQNRRTFHTVFACNLSGVLPFVSDLVLSGNQTDNMQIMLSDVYVWFIMYASAAFGWGLVWAGPHAAELFLKAFNTGQITRMQGMQQRLMEEWGEDIRHYGQEGRQ